MKPIIPVLLLLVFPLLSKASIEVQDTKGRKMNIEVVSHVNSKNVVKIKRVSDGQILSVSLAVFDSASQEKIKSIAPKPKAKLLAKVSVGRRRKNVKGSSYMETQTLSAKATIENDSRDIDLVEGKGTVFLIARQTSRFANREEDYGKVLSKQTFNATVKAGQTFEFKAKPVVTEYDSDKDSSNIGGWEYYGWVFVVQNMDGSVHTTETSIGNLKKEVDEDPLIGEVFLSLKVNQVVEKNLEKKKN